MDNIASEINHLFIDTAKNIGLCKLPKNRLKNINVFSLTNPGGITIVRLDVESIWI